MGRMKEYAMEFGERMGREDLDKEVLTRAQASLTLMDQGVDKERAIVQAIGCSLVTAEALVDEWDAGGETLVCQDIAFAFDEEDDEDWQTDTKQIFEGSRGKA